MDEPILSIDTQIKTFEEVKKEEKRQDIINYFNSKSPFGELVKINNVNFWNERWLNSTFKIEDVKKEIDNKIKDIKDGFDTLDTTFKNCEFINQMRMKFVEDLDIRDALNEKTRLEQFKKAEEE